MALAGAAISRAINQLVDGTIGTSRTVHDEAEVYGLSVNSAETLIESYSTYAGTPGVTSIEAGTWTLYAWAKADAATNCFLRAKVYKRSTAGVETLLFTVTSSALSTSYPSSVLELTSAQSLISLAATDVLVVKMYAYVTSAPPLKAVYYTYKGLTHNTRLRTPATGAPDYYLYDQDHPSIANYHVLQTSTDSGILDAGHDPWAGQVLSKPRFEIVLSSMGKHEASPSSAKASYRLDKLDVTVYMHHKLAAPVQDDKRDIVRYTALNNADRVMQALGFPGNLTTTSANTATNIISGMLLELDRDIVSEEWEGKSRGLTTAVNGKAIVKITQP